MRYSRCGRCGFETDVPAAMREHVLRVTRGFNPCSGAPYAEDSTNVGAPTSEKTQRPLEDSHLSTHHGNLAHDDCELCKAEVPSGFFETGK
jgi:hypothetical protein